MWWRCVVSLWASEYNSATSRSYGDVNIYACCCRRGESIFKGIRFTRVSLIREKCKFQREDLIIRRTYKPIYTVAAAARFFAACFLFGMLLFEVIAFYSGMVYW